MSVMCAIQIEHNQGLLVRIRCPLSVPMKDGKIFMGECHKENWSGGGQHEPQQDDSRAQPEPCTVSCSHYLCNCQKRVKDDKTAFPMIKLCGMANLSFPKMNTFEMEISVPDGKQTSEELSFIYRKKNPLSNTTHDALKIMGK